MAFDGFVYVDGVPGESTDDKHQKWIEIISLSHEFSQPAGQATSRKGGRTAERVNMGEFTVTKVIDSATPALNRHCCLGKHIDKVRVELCLAGGKQHLFMVYEMKNVIVSRMKFAGMHNEQNFVRPVEEVSFNFGSIHWEYVPIGNDGKVGAALTSDWNLQTNR